MTVQYTPVQAQQLRLPGRTLPGVAPLSRRRLFRGPFFLRFIVVGRGRVQAAKVVQDGCHHFSDAISTHWQAEGAGGGMRCISCRKQEKVLEVLFVHKSAAAFINAVCCGQSRVQPATTSPCQAHIAANNTTDIYLAEHLSTLALQNRRQTEGELNTLTPK